MKGSVGEEHRTDRINISVGGEHRTDRIKISVGEEHRTDKLRIAAIIFKSFHPLYPSSDKRKAEERTER